MGLGDIEEEFEFNEWLDSIEFVNREGVISRSVLRDDDSDDPEGDRS